MTYMSITRGSLAWTGVFKMAAWFWLDSDTNLCSCSLSGFCDLFLWWPLSCVVWYDNRLVRCLLWDALFNSSRDCKKSLHLMISLLFLYWTALLEIQLLTFSPCVFQNGEYIEFSACPKESWRLRPSTLTFLFTLLHWIFAQACRLPVFI